MILVGPSKFLPDSLIIMAAGQIIYVFFSVIMFIYPLPEMIAILTDKFPNQTERAADISSGILNLAFGLGQLIGPLYGSLVEHALDFRTTCDIAGAQIVFLGIIFSIVA